MIGVLLITHGDLAKGLKSAADLIMGEQPNFAVKGLYAEDDFNEFKADVCKAITSLDDGDGVLVLVDFFGASPYNAVAMNVTQLRESGHTIRCVTGVSLPMVIEALDARNRIPLDELYLEVMNSAKDSIRELFDELGL